MKDLEEKCCRRDCIREIPPRLVKEKRERYWKKTKKEQHAFVDEALTNRVDGAHYLNSTRICAKGWCTVYGMSISWCVLF